MMKPLDYLFFSASVLKFFSLLALVRLYIADIAEKPSAKLGGLITYGWQRWRTQIKILYCLASLFVEQLNNYAVQITSLSNSQASYCLNSQFVNQYDPVRIANPYNLFLWLMKVGNPMANLLKLTYSRLCCRPCRTTRWLSSTFGRKL